jgi:Domain of unknown function (DUF4397)
MSRVLKAVSFALAIVGLGVFAASCGNGNAQYRVVNAISTTTTYDANGFAIYMNGSSVWTNVGFPFTEPSSSGKYQSVGAGTDTLDVYPEASAGQANAQVISSALNLSGGKQYTVVLTGDTSTPLAVQKYTDNNTTIPTSGNAEFRVINASPITSNLNGVDVYVLPPGTTPSTPNAPKLSSSALTFGSVISYTNVGLPTSNALNVYVTAHGGTGQYALPFPMPISGLTGGTSIRTIVITDDGGGVSPPQLLLLTDVN